MRDVMNMQNQTSSNFGNVTNSNLLPQIQSFRSSNKPSTSYDKSRNFNFGNNLTERNNHGRVLTEGNITDNRFANQKVPEFA